MAGKGGGAWKVAYADFVTAMMAFFMVMWLVGQDEEKKQAVAEYFQDPWAKSRISMNRARKPSMQEQKAGQTNPGKQYHGSHHRLEPHSDAESPDFKQTKLVTVREPDRSTVGAVIAFESGEVEINEQGKALLMKILPQFKGLPNKIDVRGHVSPTMISAGRDDAMFDYSYQRSRSVQRFLQELGIDGERIRISIAGPYEPLYLKTDSPSDDKNARVEVFLLSETIEKFRIPDSAQRAQSSESEESPANSTATEKTH